MTAIEAILPVNDSLSTVWFDAAARGKLLLQRDPQTGRAQLYPRSHVVGAPERDPEWLEASGRATLYSYTVVHRSVHPQFAPVTPFVLAIVELEEGPRMASWIVDVPHERLRCDMPLRVLFREIHPGLTMPCFTEA